MKNSTSIEDDETHQNRHNLNGSHLHEDDGKHSNANLKSGLYFNTSEHNLWQCNCKQWNKQASEGRWNVNRSSAQRQSCFIECCSPSQSTKWVQLLKRAWLTPESCSQAMLCGHFHAFWWPKMIASSFLQKEPCLVKSVSFKFCFCLFSATWSQQPSFKILDMTVSIKTMKKKSSKNSTKSKHVFKVLLQSLVMIETCVLKPNSSACAICGIKPL